MCREVLLGGEEHMAQVCVVCSPLVVLSVLSYTLKNAAGYGCPFNAHIHLNFVLWQWILCAQTKFCILRIHGFCFCYACGLCGLRSTAQCALSNDNSELNMLISKCFSV